MASDRQIAANRLNAQNSTGPRTPNGKRRSRQNALRHGLTAQTVIGTLEDTEEYRAFEADIMAGCKPRSSVEQSLASRLASLLWRLQRATTIESGLFEAELRSLRQQPTSDSPSIHKPDETLRALFSLNRLSDRQHVPDASDHHKDSTATATLDTTQGRNQSAKPALAQSFLQLADYDSGVLDRLSRYETALWRQAAQTVVLLNTFKWSAKDLRRRPRCRFRPAQQRRHRFFPTQFYEPR